ncbi:hypothetical protein FD754_021469 [Muntiacus muntjak]|uniref:G-protein coupled receptors family 1 profile domain-containing protein n=1 Tax=Muntiacus muntjak TaxID=9888 RepID=A0A5N3V5V9_MUNMU|nr:hypothetical protein FD754_021469 [Muntiacus muntjak]
MRNHTTLTTFILLGLSKDPQLQVVICLLLFFTYLLSITGNLIIITLTLLDSHLKTPIYFFLQNFSFLEISFTTVCIPKFLVSMATAQLFFTILLGATKFCLLAAMSYEYSGLISFRPLHYGAIMNSKICTLLIFYCWIAGFFIIFVPLLLTIKLDFCTSNIVDHFICFFLYVKPSVKENLFTGGYSIPLLNEDVYYNNNNNNICNCSFLSFIAFDNHPSLFSHLFLQKPCSNEANFLHNKRYYILNFLYYF